MASVPHLPPEWYHARFQAVGRAQSRYLLLLLLVFAYTVGLRVTSSATVSVAILGLGDVPKAVVSAFAVPVLAVLLLALHGTFKAASVAFADLLARLGEQGLGTLMRHVDNHPNVTDFFGYVTFIEGRRGMLGQVGLLVFYPLPVLVIATWTVMLWWQGVSAPVSWPSWLAWVYRLSTLLVVPAVLYTIGFLRRRWQKFRVGE